jgi:hypothetical protein
MLKAKTTQGWEVTEKRRKALFCWLNITKKLTYAK